MKRLSCLALVMLLLASAGLAEEAEPGAEEPAAAPEPTAEEPAAAPEPAAEEPAAAPEKEQLEAPVAGLEEPPVVEVEEEPEQPLFRAYVRPVTWLGFSACQFRKDGGTPGTTFSLEETFGTGIFHFLPFVEGLIRTGEREFRIKYMWWRSSGSKTLGGNLNFGSASFLGGDNVSADLGTSIWSVAYVQPIYRNRSFEFQFNAAAEVLNTELVLSNPVRGSDRIKELIPVFTVGLEVSFRLMESWWVNFSSTALSYSQLFGLKERFFNVEDEFRNVEFGAYYRYREKLDLGFGWRYHKVAFDNQELLASQMMRGFLFWMRYLF